MESNTETELAFNLLMPRGHFTAHPLLNQLEPQVKHMQTEYFDTPSHMLARALWSLSVRTSDGLRPVQRVKGPTVAASRAEIEAPIDSPIPNLSLLRETPIWRIILGHEREIEPVFKTNVMRTIYNIHTPSATIEVAIDEGNILAPDGRLLPINDVEFELKSGSVGSLFTIATRFALDLGLKLEVASKAERGYALINHAEPLVHKHGDIILYKTASTLDCFRTIIEDTIAHLRSNLKAAYSGNPDGVHQLRVAIRRMRAALFMFRHLLTRETVQTFDLELKHFSGVFGDARDWDVFITQTLPAVGKESAQSDWRALIEPLAIDEQQRAHRLLRQEMDGRAFNSLLLSIMGWVEDGLIIQTSPKLKRPIMDTLPMLLMALNDRVDNRLRKLDEHEKSSHDLRKR
jgi:triphosphatase